MTNNIYTYLEEKFNIKISEQDYKFKRDYIKEPLQKNKSGFITYIEEPFKEDIEYLYIQLNLSTIKMIQLLNISQRYFNKLCNKFEIKKDTKLVQINVQSSFNEKYGVPFYSQTPEYIQKIKKAYRNKCGYDYYFQSNEFKERFKQTNIKKYGIENYSQTQECQQRKKQTCLKKYGVEYSSQTIAFQQKSYNTRKQNNTFNKSKSEELIYKTLCTRFGKVSRQYRTEQYPFNCDFYIPEIDTYIEYNGYWSHGKEPYDSTNEQHINKIKLWEQRSKELNFKGQPKKQYNNAINVWTISDPKKRQIAKQNGLNWFEFFNLQQFEQWFNNICK